MFVPCSACLSVKESVAKTRCASDSLHFFIADVIKSCDTEHNNMLGFELEKSTIFLIFRC